MRTFLFAVVLALALLPAACGAEGGGTNGAGGGGSTPQPPPDYALVYDDTQLLEYEIEMSLANWNTLQAAPEEYVSGAFKFGAETYSNIGVRFKGNSSLWWGNDKKSFKVHMNEYDPDLRFHGLKKLNFHGGFKDPSLIREKLAYELLAAAGAPAPRTAHVRLYVTVPGLYTREYFGVYTNTEMVNKAFCKDRFNDDEGNLFKAETGADCRYLGSDPNLYRIKYELQTNETTPDYSDLINFLFVLNNTPAGQLKAALDPIFDVDGFLAGLAGTTLLSSLDSYQGSAHNYFLYHNLTTGKFQFIPWDMNEAFGQFKSGWTNAELVNLNVFAPYGKNETGTNRPLVSRILGVPEYRAAYEAKLRTLLPGAFSTASMNARIDQLYALIQLAAYADTHKDYTNADFDASLTTDVRALPSPPMAPTDFCIGLKPFVANRSAAVADQLP